MKAHELAEILLKHPDLEVYLTDWNEHYIPAYNLAADEIAVDESPTNTGIFLGGGPPVTPETWLLNREKLRVLCESAE